MDVVVSQGRVSRLRKLWCEWTHGGGKIERDHLGRIDAEPVPLSEILELIGESS